MVVCISKKDSELGEASLRMRREILGDLWDDVAECEMDNNGYDMGPKDL